jgi:N6-L-threonylcarbamoyladenine synthase
MVEIDHMNAHILVHFATDDTHTEVPDFPFLCLTVSGGHTQIVVVKDYFDMEVIGKTIDDAAGEAFDKTAKILGLPYPGGPVIDKLAKVGNPNAFSFAKPQIPDLDYSFSGLKTSILYTVRDNLKTNPNFIEENKADLCASVQKTIIDILMNKLVKASKQTGIKTVAIAGGVSANSGLHDAMLTMGEKYHWKVFIPRLSYSTDNAAMVAVAGYFKYLKGEFASQDLVPYARQSLKGID